MYLPECNRFWTAAFEMDNLCACVVYVSRRNSLSLTLVGSCEYSARLMAQIETIVEPDSR